MLGHLLDRHGYQLNLELTVEEVMERLKTMCFSTSIVVFCVCIYHK